MKNEKMNAEQNEAVETLSEEELASIAGGAGRRPFLEISHADIDGGVFSTPPN